ncbi:expressed unknown protein [Seminavis robusta]|uniref:F-box domain-containing protein n=1 Tax=Seminavis robusta TaxID=568900 RepID=A0A9N8DZU7_9STRA|nr:expressed unknown protein [Seminavis robusta]|eukprot:Sro373_g129040.1 n/a (385) ;mRNA; r:42919-44073
MDTLSDDLLVRIWSYVGGGGDDGVDTKNRPKFTKVEVAAAAQHTLVPVCQKWKDLFEQRTKEITGLFLEWTCDTRVPTPIEAAKIAWLLQRKKQNNVLGSVVITSESSHPMLPHQVRQVMQECDTDHVKSVEWYETSSSGKQSSKKRGGASQQFLDLVASECPSVQHLHLNLPLLYIRADHRLVQKLRLSSLTTLQLVFTEQLWFSCTGTYGGENVLAHHVDGTMIQGLLQGLPNLQELFFHVQCTSGALEEREQPHFVIRSNNLRLLSLEGLGWVTCHCPKLQRFLYDSGSLYRNTTVLPVISSQSQFDALESQMTPGSGDIGDDGALTMVTTNNALAVLGLEQVHPDGCVCTVKNFPYFYEKGYPNYQECLQKALRRRNQVH